MDWGVSKVLVDKEINKNDYKKTKNGRSTEVDLRIKECGQCEVEWAANLPRLETSYW